MALVASIAKKLALALERRSGMAKYQRRGQRLPGLSSGFRKGIVSDPGTVKILPDANYWIGLARALECTPEDRRPDQTAAVELHDLLRNRGEMADGSPIKLLTSRHILSRVEEGLRTPCN